MSEDRNNIPADIKRKIFVEAGHRCAIPTCRALEVEIHHIIPWEKCHKHNYENLIALCPTCHTRADRGEIDRKSLKMYKNNLRMLYDKFTIFEIDLLYELDSLPLNQAAQFPPFMKLFIKRLIESAYVEYIQTPMGISIGGMKSNPDYVKITDFGRDFITQISTEDIGY
jgi:hypothetical protein